MILLNSNVIELFIFYFHSDVTFKIMIVLKFNNDNFKIYINFEMITRSSLLSLI
jgi:hypothetical protein